MALRHLRPLVAESWARSAGGGASPDGSRLPAIRLSSDELGSYRAQHPLASLLPVFRDLLGQTARDEDHLFAIADADGTLLWVEGAHAVRARAERMHFIEGAVWSEDQAGTNAPGTALAVGRPVQISGAEHFSSAVQSWSCCAVPIHDPDGRLLGVVDVTGDERMATPHALALVRATARAAEVELARRGAVADEHALRSYLDQLERSTQQPAALLTAGGRILHATGVDSHDLARPEPLTPGPLTLPDGRQFVVEPVGGDGHILVRCDEPGHARREPSPVRLTALGQDCVRLTADGHTHRLSHRHSEIVVVLSLMVGGVSGERLAVDLSEREIPLVNLRVEMSRLRAQLGTDVLGSRPYALRRAVQSDYFDLRDVLAVGRVDEALAAYAGPVLPWSDAPAIVELRRTLEQQLRSAVLASGDPVLLRRWVDAPWGADDLQAWRTLADRLPGGSPQRAAAASRARTLLGETPVPRRRPFGHETHLLRPPH